MFLKLFMVLHVYCVRQLHDKLRTSLILAGIVASDWSCSREGTCMSNLSLPQFCMAGHRLIGLS